MNENISENFLIDKLLKFLYEDQTVPGFSQKWQLKFQWIKLIHFKLSFLSANHSGAGRWFDQSQTWENLRPDWRHLDNRNTKKGP